MIDLIEQAFREGYRAGYNDGGNDQSAYEWGSGSKHDSVLKRNQDQAWQESEIREEILKKDLPTI